MVVRRNSGLRKDSENDLFVPKTREMKWEINSPWPVHVKLGFGVYSEASFPQTMETEVSLPRTDALIFMTY